MDCREAMPEAFAVGLVVDLDDYDLVDHDRDPDDRSRSERLVARSRELALPR